MENVLNILRNCEYMAENFENDHYGACTQDEIRQANYEYLYFRDLADYLEIMLKKEKYTNQDMIIKMREFFNKKYSDFKENSRKVISNKKKVILLKESAFRSVYDVLEDALSQI